MLDHNSGALGSDDRATDGAPFQEGRLGHYDRHLRLAPAVVFLLAWLVACGDNTSTPSGDGGGASDATGGDATTGGDTGGDGARQDTGSVADAGSSDGAGDDGTADAGLMEAAPVPSLCDGKPQKPLPYAPL